METEVMTDKLADQTDPLCECHFQFICTTAVAVCCIWGHPGKMLTQLY